MKNRLINRIFILTICIFLAGIVDAQEKCVVKGKVTDIFNHGLPLVNVSIFGTSRGTITDNKGEYSLVIPANTEVTILYSFIGYHSQKEQVFLKPGQEKAINKKLVVSSKDISGVEIKDERVNRGSPMVRINPRTATLLPTSSGSGIEALVKTMPGVASKNELSSQYSVRGGNFDENLVYVNDIEIYRPFLVRSGEQEGLSFLNQDMVSSIQFSAGGFEAKYGDKMSSVLDIQYKRPKEFGGSVTMSLLGASAHVEGSLAKEKLGFLLGVRQKSNQYILNSMQTKGEYKPSFTDVQTYITYIINNKSELSFLGNYARNLFRVVPEDRETAFGTLTEAYHFKVYFEGQEKDKFENYLGGLTYTYRPQSNTSLKLILTTFRSSETESFDILGQYYLSTLETDWGSDEFGAPAEPIGVGSYLNHARNTLDARVFNLEQRGVIEKPGRLLNWGLKVQHEQIDDRMSEWTLIDSAGYSLPHPSDSVGYTNPSVQPDYELILQDVLKCRNQLNSNRYTGFIQQSWSFTRDSIKWTYNAGIRGQFWDVNEQVLISPRVSMSIKPNWKRDILFRVASGVYHQPPFYREIRRTDGSLNKELKAQSSYQIVAGSDLNFIAWERPFKFVSEVYFKYLENLVSYEVDNVRIRYSGENDAKGYAMGIDLRVNGEFVKGTDSWASLSIMQTREDITNDFYIDDSGDTVHPGYLARPTDQRINFSLFFQDYLPSNPTFKMYLNTIYGSSMRFGPPKSPRYKHTYKTPPYFRIDIGFSKMIKSEESRVSNKNILHHFKQMWLSFEIFNLLQVSNTISYLWVSDVNNQQYAIPNYLTPRQINLKLYAQF